MTVLDTSGAIDFVIGDRAYAQVAELFLREGVLAVPDLLTFEVVAVLRRHVQRGALDAARAHMAIDDLGDLPVEIFPTLPLRSRVWELRDNFTAADGFFVALAEQLDEPLATKDRGLASAARTHTGVQVLILGT
ncbi:MAG: type II toxin-antitoxin system VapC family toxin [Actinomycetota bacterium]